MDHDRLRERVRGLWETSSPDKLPRLDECMEHYKGNEHCLGREILRWAEGDCDAQDRDRLRERLRALWEKQSPHKLHQLDECMEHYRGIEANLVEELDQAEKIWS